jgi:hypothetical protein
MDGLVRTTGQARTDEEEVANTYLRLSDSLGRELRFPEARLYLGKGDTVYTRLAAAAAAKELLAKEWSVTSSIFLHLRGYWTWWALGLLGMLTGLLCRGLSVRRSVATVKALEDRTGGSTGVSFAEVLEGIAHELAQPPPLGIVARRGPYGAEVGPALLMVDRAIAWPDLSLKVSAFELKNILPWMSNWLFPTRFLVDGAVVAVGGLTQLHVRLSRVRFLRRRQRISRWVFDCPSSDSTELMGELRMHGHRVIFRLLREGL